MSTAARVRLRRALARICLAALIVGLAAFACFLPLAGRFLVRQDSMETADAIFVLAGGRVDRWLEGVELYRERIAPTIVLSPGLITKAEYDLRARGVRYPAEAELARDAMLQLGVPADAIRILAGTVDNTAHEAEALHQLARESGWRKVVIVTSPYHTRRTGFAFRRELRGSGVHVLVRGSRFDESDPPHWWRHRADIRFVTSELQKLALYGLGLGS